MNQAALWRELKKLRLLKVEPEGTHLPALCHEGALEGGVSLSLRLTPEEAFGPLTWAMEGAARNLKLVDVRGERLLELHVRIGEQLEKWEVESVEQLVHNLNDLFKDDAEVRRIIPLGEWEDMQQWWCVSAQKLPQLRALRLL